MTSADDVSFHRGLSTKKRVPTPKAENTKPIGDRGDVESIRFGMSILARRCSPTFLVLSFSFCLTHLFDRLRLQSVSDLQSDRRHEENKRLKRTRSLLLFSSTSIPLASRLRLSSSSSVVLRLSSSARFCFSLNTATASLICAWVKAQVWCQCPVL